MGVSLIFCEITFPKIWLTHVQWAAHTVHSQNMGKGEAMEGMGYVYKKPWYRTYCSMLLVCGNVSMSDKPFAASGTDITIHICTIQLPFCRGKGFNIPPFIPLQQWQDTVFHTNFFLSFCNYAPCMFVCDTDWDAWEIIVVLLEFLLFPVFISPWGIFYHEFVLSWSKHQNINVKSPFFVSEKGTWYYSFVPVKCT